MTNKLRLLLPLMVLFSCREDFQSDQKEIVPLAEMEQVIKNEAPEKIQVLSYDGCEYLIYTHDHDANSSYGFMAHKGNCSNPIHSPCLSD